MRPDINGVSDLAERAADEGGYNSVSEFVRDAVRHRAAEILDESNHE